MKTFRIIAHIFIFGFALGAILKHIAQEWSVFDNWLYVFAFGFLLSWLAEFAQAWHYTNVRPNEPDSFRWNDVLKNLGGVILGAIVHSILGDAVYFIGLVLMLIVIGYAIIQVVRKRAI